jgi:hypothetical protein
MNNGFLGFRTADPDRPPGGRSAASTTERSLATSLALPLRGSLAAPDGYHTLALPDHPTDARPGTKEKIAIMAERAAAGRCCFHPKDAVDRPLKGTFDH